MVGILICIWSSRKILVLGRDSDYWFAANLQKEGDHLQARLYFFMEHESSQFTTQNYSHSHSQNKIKFYRRIFKYATTVCNDMQMSNYVVVLHNTQMGSVCWISNNRNKKYKAYYITPTVCYLQSTKTCYNKGAACWLLHFVEQQTYSWWWVQHQASTGDVVDLLQKDRRTLAYWRAYDITLSMKT